MANQPQPTPEELLGHHFAYEIQQMVAALTLLGQVKVPEEWSPGWQKALNNALMESFYMHARALFEFFKKSRGAQEYAVKGYKPFKNIDPDDWIKRLNNQAAHLLDGRTSDDRLKVSDQERFEINNALSDEVEVFKRALKPEYAAIAIVIPSIPKVAPQAPAPPSATNHPRSIGP